MPRAGPVATLRAMTSSNFAVSCIRRASALGLLSALLVVSACGSPRDPQATGDVTVHSIRIDSTNIGVIVGPERTLLVDIGLVDAFSKLGPALQERGIDESAVTDMVLTHGHGDHAGDANAVQAAGIEVWAHRKEKAVLNSEIDVSEGEIIGCEAHLLTLVIDHAWEPVTPDHWMDGPTDFDDLNVRVIPASGHTPGSVIVVVNDEIAFVGDLLRGGSLGGAIAGDQPQVHYFHTDQEAAHRSLRGLLKGFPNIDTFWPAHGDAMTRDQIQTFVDSL